MDPATVAAPAAPAAPVAPTTAGVALTSVPAGPEWAASFKNESLKAYVQERKFTDPEQLAERYQSLEKLRGVPEERLLKLPEKLEGDEARAVFERLGAPKDVKGYEIPRDEKSDQKFLGWAEETFLKNSLTKTQAQGVVGAFNDFQKAQVQAHQESQRLAIQHADESLKTEWGPHYEKNLTIAKQGARILGLDAKTLDVIEAVQGRESLFKTLQKIGVSVGESDFVSPNSGAPAVPLTTEQANAKIKEMMQDKKFVKKVSRGDADALATWNELNRLAAPGEKSIG